MDLQFIYGYLPEFGERAQRDGWWFGEVDVSGRMETVKRLVRGTSSEDPTVRRIFGLPFAFQEVDGTWRVYWGLVTYNAELKMYLQRDMGLQPRKQNRVSFLKSTEWLAMNLLYKLETGDYVLYGNILLSLPGEAQSSGLRPESKERIDSSVLEDRVKLLSVSDDKVVVQARAVIVKMLGDEHIRGDFLLLDGFVTAARHARMLSNVHTNNGGDRANDETICRIEWTSHFGQLWRYKMVEEPHYINLTKRALDSLTANESREEVGSEVMDAFVILLRNKQSASDKRCFLSSIFWTALKEYTAQDLPDVIEFARGIFESSIWFDKTEFIMPLRFVKSDGGGVYWVVAWVQMQDKELHIFNTNIANYQVEMIYADCLCNFFSSFVALQDCQQGLSDFQPDNNFIGSRVGLTSWNVVIDAPCNQQEEDSCSSGVLSMGHIWEIFNERAIHDRVSSANLRREFGEMIQNAASSETSMLLWPPLEGFD